MRILSSVVLLSALSSVVMAEPSPSPDAVGMVRIHVDADHAHVELLRIVGSAPAGFLVSGGLVTPLYAPVFETVCQAPCDKVVDGRDGADFFFGGKDITSSSTFTLSDQHGGLRADVHPGSARRRTRGMWMTTIGASVAVGGSVGFGLSIGDSDRRTFAEVTGGIAIAGLATAVVGAYMLASSGTDYDFTPATF